MKHISKIGMAVVASGMLAATSCSDFSDYNAAPGANEPAADKTLWENIAANENLSDFAEALQRVGYDKILNASQTYTVWAPVNGSFDKDSLLELSDAKIEREFVRNLIAYYAHKETDLNDTTVYMLNEKLLKFSDKNSPFLAFDSKRVLPNEETGVYNYPSVNGLLYTVANPATFRHNGYEMIGELSPIANKMFSYVNRYESVWLDERNSVKGEIIDGVQHYDDSVLYVHNTLIEGRLASRLNNEDSLYTVVIPTDQAWDESYNTISKYYKYIPSIAYQDLSHRDVGSTKGGSTTSSNVTIMAPTTGSTTINLSAAPADAELQNTAEYWTDSITKYRIVENSIFSETIKRYNGKLATGAPFAEKDTLYSTSRNYLVQPSLLTDATEEIRTLSNGHARIVNKFPFRPQDTYAPVFKSNRPERVVNAPGYGVTNYYMPNPVGVQLEDGETILRWVRTELPDNSNFAPELDFYLTNILSTTYDVYVVMVSGTVDNEEPKPYSLRVDINYTDEDNVQRAGRFNGETVVTKAQDLKKVMAFETNPNTLVDTVYCGRFTCPISYYRTNCAPNIKVMHALNTFTSSNKKKYEQRLRVANVILKPVQEQEDNATKED